MEITNVISAATAVMLIVTVTVGLLLKRYVRQKKWDMDGLGSIGRAGNKHIAKFE